MTLNGRISKEALWKEKYGQERGRDVRNRAFNNALAGCCRRTKGRAFGDDRNNRSGIETDSMVTTVQVHVGDPVDRKRAMSSAIIRRCGSPSYT